MLFVKALKDRLRQPWCGRKSSGSVEASTESERISLEATPRSRRQAQTASYLQQSPEPSGLESPEENAQPSCPELPAHSRLQQQQQHQHQPSKNPHKWLKRAMAKITSKIPIVRKSCQKKNKPPKKARRTRKGVQDHDDGARTTTSDIESIYLCETEEVDLCYFYDQRSEDPVNRMIFITGPEHFYYLALQLETSPQVEYQLYGKELFIRSAGLGYAPAQFKLGICYELGLTHFPMDPSLSFAWYTRAAMQGHADAELAISGWYLTGHPHGLIQSEPLAYEWAAKAARQGWSKAEYTLGHYHEVGIGVPQDLQIAKHWYLKAAARGNERALLRLLVGHVGLEVDYAHLKDALLLHNENNPYLIHQLAQFHELREYGLVPDEDAAFELYAASAQANYAPAQYKLGACYEFGILGCPQDPVQAVHWYGQGADNGHVEALLALAGFYLDGSAGSAAEQSDEEAFRFVKAAAQRGVPKAEYITGFFLEYGLGVEKNMREAKQWYHLACAKGVDSAERRLKQLENATTTA